VKGVRSFSERLRDHYIPRAERWARKRKWPADRKEKAKEILARRKLQYRVLTDLPFLAHRYLGYMDITDASCLIDFHGEITAELENLPEKNRQILVAPRGHLKTSYIEAWLTQKLMDLRNVRVFLMSADNDRALDSNRNIQGFLEMQSLIDLFPRRLWANPFKEAPAWNREGFVLPRDQNVSGMTVKAQSIYGKMTGQHYEIILLDDPQDDENTATRDRMDKVKTKIKNSMSVLEPEGWMVYIGTPWGREDVLTWVEEFGWPIWRRSCVVEKINHAVNTRLPDDPRDDYLVDLLFPAKWTLDRLREVKAVQKKFFFSCQGECDALPDDAVAFKEEWFQFSEVVPREISKVYVMCDPAISKSRKADDSVILVAIQPKMGAVWIQKSRALRANVQGVIDALFAEYKYWHDKKVNVGVYVEVIAYQHALKQWIEKDQKEKHIYFIVGELKPGGRRKTTRIANLQPMFENGGIRMSQRNTVELRRQLVNFDGTLNKRDDHADILGYLPDVLEDALDVEFYSTIDWGHKDKNSLEAMIDQMAGVGTKSWDAY